MRLFNKNARVKINDIIKTIYLLDLELEKLEKLKKLEHVDVEVGGVIKGELYFYKILAINIGEGTAQMSKGCKTLEEAYNCKIKNCDGYVVPTYATAYYPKRINLC